MNDVDTKFDGAELEAAVEFCRSNMGPMFCPMVLDGVVHASPRIVVAKTKDGFELVRVQ